MLYALSTAYRSVIFVSVVWFVAAVSQLDREHAALARDAVSDERARLSASLATALGDRLVGLMRVSGRARALMAADRDDEVGPALQTLAADAREALDTTRQIVTGLRGAEARGELLAVRALLTNDDGSPT